MSADEEDVESDDEEGVGADSSYSPPARTTSEEGTLLAIRAQQQDLATAAALEPPRASRRPRRPALVPTLAGETRGLRRGWQWWTACG